MNLTTLVNASLQTIATALIIIGGGQITKALPDYTGGVILIVAGLLAYVIYEKLPDSPRS